MKVLSVIGYSNTGKTTLIENLIKELKDRGYTVGTVKEVGCNNFTIDKQGTNTYRHKLAGSQQISARSSQETDIMYQNKLELEELLMYYNQDYVILEGITDERIPNIVMGVTLEDVKEKIDGNTLFVSGVIANNFYEFNKLEIINCKTRIKKITDIIERRVNEFKTKGCYTVICGKIRYKLKTNQNIKINKLFKELSVKDNEIIIKKL